MKRGTGDNKAPLLSRGKELEKGHSILWSGYDGATILIQFAGRQVVRHQETSGLACCEVRVVIMMLITLTSTARRLSH